VPLWHESGVAFGLLGISPFLQKLFLIIKLTPKTLVNFTARLLSAMICYHKKTHLSKYFLQFENFFKYFYKI